jgi:hypothetical protein
VALSGLLIWLLPFGAGSQTTVLFHTIAGALLLVPLMLWLLTHWLATRKKGRGVGNILAYAGFCLLGICIAAGLIITYQALFGTFASHFWANIHLWSGVLAVPVLAYHVLPREQEGVPGNKVSAESTPSNPSPYRSRSWKRAFAMAAALCTLPAVGGLAYARHPFPVIGRPPASSRRRDPILLLPAMLKPRTAGRFRPRSRPVRTPAAPRDATVPFTKNGRQALTGGRKKMNFFRQCGMQLRKCRASQPRRNVEAAMLRSRCCRDIKVRALGRARPDTRKATPVSFAMPYAM